MLQRSLPAGRKARICVVGAGVSGLRCAGVLLKHGFDVTILEARNRIGGRVGQKRVGGHLVDLGANWLHGHSDSNDISRLARETGTVLHEWEESSMAFSPSGQALPPERVDEVYDVFWGIMSDAWKYSARHTAEIPASRSLLSFVREKSAAKFLDDPPDVAEQKRYDLLEEAQAWGAFVGSETDRQSLKFYWMEGHGGDDDSDSGKSSGDSDRESENPFVASTFARILERVAEPALQGARLLTEHVVRGIKAEHAPDGSDRVAVKASTPAAAAGATTFEDHFDEVVVTLPLGYLKQHAGIFDPPLPERLTSAIRSLGYGNLDKVYISFPRALWLDDDDPGTDTKAASTQAPQPPRPSFYHYQSPAYAPGTNPGHWPQEACNLAVMPASTAHPTLLFYVFGACARHIASLAQHPDPAGARARLVAFFQPYFSRLPHYAADRPECTPDGVLATAWSADDFAGYGSYSNFQVGAERCGEDMAVLREGLPERRVWIAGEHTADHEVYATVTGAYYSGEAVAKRIAAAYRSNEGSSDRDHSKVA